MFTKKMVIMLAVALVLVLAGGIGAYRYWQQQNFQVTSESESPNLLENSGIEVNGGGQGGLFICSDKCGDGICQATEDKACKNANCACMEDRAVCPQDCK